jgi:tRNA-2-methylthio-N6-dimethylallyladenosine synthase
LVLIKRRIMSFFGAPERFFIETYGCQMNMADSEVVGGILKNHGYEAAASLDDADIVLLNTCAVRENAEQRIYGRLGLMQGLKRRRPGVLVGLLGCMAERLREQLVEEERVIDVIVGPDEYRKLPMLLAGARGGEKGIATRLSRVENYEDIVPFRADGVSAWLSVMRGCDKFCSFCVVPFTRGRERSRSLRGVVDEVAELAARGFKDITLLGQNVNSYIDGDKDFADLLEAVALVDRSVRVRFTTSHPQDMSDRLIESIARNENICKYIHLPVQSGSDRMLRLMNRNYTVEHYVKLVEKIRSVMPGVSVTTDLISGFPTETEEEHRATLALVAALRFDGAYTFKYSPREKTKAADIPETVSEEEKGRRVQEVTELQHAIALEINKSLVGTVAKVLVDGPSKKSEKEYTGRTDTNKTVVFPRVNEAEGEYVDILIDRANSATLFGRRRTVSAYGSEQAA